MIRFPGMLWPKFAIFCCKACMGTDLAPITPVTLFCARAAIGDLVPDNPATGVTGFVRVGLWPKGGVAGLVACVLGVLDGFLFDTLGIIFTPVAVVGWVTLPAVFGEAVFGLAAVTSYF